MPAAPPLFLAVAGASGNEAHRLPRSGVVTIGRDADCDVVIDDPSVSRRHAELHLGPPTTLRDLGSSNGTRVRRHGVSADTTQLFEVRVEGEAPVPIGLGEAMSLGSVLAFLRQGEAAPDAAAAAGGGEEPVAIDAEMIRVRDLATRIARGPVAVLVYGETGAGKEVLARLVHRSSPRAEGPMVAINCGALPESLAESELFGHERGAFTGAMAAKPGLFESAHGGTLFLDEVAELSPALQTKLLRVIEDKQVQRLGALAPRKVDVRIVSATHRDLAAWVRDGRFHKDLYFRLAGMTLTVPPLRARRADIAALARLFAERTAWAMGEKPPRLSPSVIARLQAHDWPGNVRELRNAVERAVVLASGATILPAHLYLDDTTAPEAGVGRPAADATLKGELDELEKRRVVEALERVHGNQTKAAELLGMPRRTLVARLSRYGIERPRKR
ncbi:MAG: sigma 54-interacting transcriptional regulator [Polyangiaceae bacterium]